MAQRTIQLRPNPLLSQKAVERLLCQVLDELLQQRPEMLVICRRASFDVDAPTASTAVDSRVREVICWSVRNGLIFVFDRNRAENVHSTFVPG